MDVISWGCRFITMLFAGLLILLAFTVISSKISGTNHHIFGYQLKSVLSGSMEPTFMTGSIIAIKPGGDLSRFQAGDIIIFKRNETMLVTHRVVDVIVEDGQVLYKTKGDNNNVPDRELVNSQNVVGYYIGLTIPYAGYLFSYASTKLGSALLLIIPGLLLISNSFFSLRREVLNIEESTE